MKANLPLKEPEILLKWEKNNLYKKLRTNSKGKKNLFFTMAHMQMDIFIWEQL